jgi:hypothetical protein
MKHLQCAASFSFSQQLHEVRILVSTLQMRKLRHNRESHTPKVLESQQVGDWGVVREGGTQESDLIQHLFKMFFILVSDII